MRKGFRIARLFGINIEVDWSWLLIFALITWSLVSNFSAVHGDWGIPLVWGLGLLASLLFFISVLLHELAHSLYARARGLPVNRIVLFLFGGVSNIEREPPSPGVEFWMAVVGPLMSVMLGLGFLIGGSLTTSMTQVVVSSQETLSQLSPVSTLLLWLGSVNLLLGIFNLVPGFPLDGGRILRSALWAISDDLRQATRWATRVGRFVAWLMILTGFGMAFGIEIPLLGTGLISGLWLVFIGWFLESNAVASYQMVVLKDLLEDVPVGQLMRPDPPTVAPWLTVEQLVNDGIMGTDEHAFPVVEKDRLLGLVTLKDIRKIPRTEWENTVISEIMTPVERIDSVTVDEDASEAMSMLRRNDVRQLPVMRDGTLVGLLRRKDIIRWLQLQTDQI